MLCELVTCAVLAADPTPTRAAPPVPLRRVARAPVVLDRGSWADSGDYGIPGWFNLHDGKIHLRPETRRAIRGRCGDRRVRSLAVFVLMHEAGHAHGIISEAGANSYAYQHIGRAARQLRFKLGPLPGYGSLLSTWRSYRLRCLP